MTAADRRPMSAALEAALDGLGASQRAVLRAQAVESPGSPFGALWAALVREVDLAEWRERVAIDELEAALAALPGDVDDPPMPGPPEGEPWTDNV